MIFQRAITKEIKMELDHIDILDREDRIFKSFRSVVELMGGSPCQEVREAQNALDFLLDEYQGCREALRKQ